MSVGNDFFEAVVASHARPWRNAAEFVDQRSIDRNPGNPFLDRVLAPGRRDWLFFHPVTCALAKLCRRESSAIDGVELLDAEPVNQCGTQHLGLLRPERQRCIEQARGDAREFAH